MGDPPGSAFDSAAWHRSAYQPPLPMPVLRPQLPPLPAPVPLPSHDWENDLAAYARRSEMARDFRKRTWQSFRGSKLRPPLFHAQTAGLIRLFDMTPGQCSHTKLEAIISLFPDLPEGDIVEIGTLFGRTALAFAFLASRYRTGKVMCVDPWSSGELFQAFIANLAPWSGVVNYIRKPSTVASAIYASGAPVASPEFGTTEYSLGISLLHIDGNREIEAVRSDLTSWGGFLRPDGWIIFDGYRRPFGDGSRQVADEFCRDFEGHWSTAFEAGGALFVRLNGTRAFHSANRSLLWECAGLH